MAAFHGQSLGRVSLGGGGDGVQYFVLPNGHCSYRDLSTGAKAPTCGCRRFWLNTAQYGNQGERAWCFCGHHACFHDNVISADPQAQATAQPVENIPNVFPSSHQVTAPNRGFQAPTWSELIASPGIQSERSSQRNIGTKGLGIRDTEVQPEPQSQSVNARLWQALNNFARDQEGGRLPSDTSRLPSTAVPSIYDEPRTGTPTQILQSHERQPRPMGPPVSIPPVNITGVQLDEYSATEVATELGTPSIRGTPDLRTLVRPAVQAFTSPPCPGGPASKLAAEQDSVGHQHQPHTSQPTPPPTASVGPSLSVSEICNTILDYGRRISVLESVSFSHMPSDEVQDRFDLFDGRVLDLEHWRVDQDRSHAVDNTDDRLNGVSERLNDLENWRIEQDRSRTSQESDTPEGPTSSRKRRRHPFETSSSASEGSFDADAAAQTETVVLATLAANAETRPRIDALESRIFDLESAALPSFTRPWHVQVVVLPFGRQLPGAWFSASESTEHSLRSATQALDEWEGPQAVLKSSFHSTNSGGWTTESIEAWNHSVETDNIWLSPKACGPRGHVFQRLASRGLIRDVVLQAPDARHICNSILHAFGNVLYGAESTRSDAAERYQGLRESFIPLRKVRKSSRLRFLTPAEMVTSATWNADFLESSVFMKLNDGERRLYLTTSEGYTQPAQPGWSWPLLKDLPAYGIDGELQAAQNVGNLVESCWSYNDRLDQASSLHSSFVGSDASPWESSSEDDGLAQDGKQDAPAVSPMTTRRSHMRSVSLPSSSSAHIVDDDTAPKVRVASFEMRATKSSEEYAPEYVSKRRRISTSPELERRGVNFTPRWSREPPSPYTTDDSGMARSSQAASTRNRGTTPFAYATPHSHFDSRGGDVDTEIDDTGGHVGAGASAHGDDLEEWGGVQDGTIDTESLLLHGDSRADGDGMEDYFNDSGGEANLDDGSAIYEG